MVEGLHPLVDPLAPMLPGRIECFAIQLARVDAEDLAAQPLDRLDLDPPGARPAGRPPATERTSPLSALDPASCLQVLDALLGGAGP